MNLLTNLWAIPFPNIDPVALQIGPVAIKWYGLAYLAGLLLGWLYIRRLLSEAYLWADNKPPFRQAQVDDLLLYITAGVVLGGRLGFVIFYEPSYYLANPQDIIAVWKGGMAFHGALVGCIIAIWAFARRNGVSPWSTGDLVTAAVPIGLFFGRVANFINGELFGRPTSLPWGMVFPEAALHHPDVEPTPRHPSQLYEAALEGLLLFLVLRLLTHYFDALKRPGVVSGVFLVGYALARSTSELFREPHFAHAFNVGPLTAGIVYSIPMLLLGLFVVYLARTRELK
ncbi:MAG TPA: prolipoprotein diacylglyceryl transferase [Hyphomicrobium sp.]|jgi:phosphatidylglycerol:prolipoprotein diacylglycerol transferase